jgi:hypothetical protein
MTLKENFENIIYNYIGSEWDRRDVSNSLETDADEFAIEFAEWYLNLWHTDDDSSFDNNSPQELLQIYKKTL